MNTNVNSENELRTGTVFKKAIGTYWVKSDSEIVVCSVSTKLRKVLVYPEADPSSRRPTVDKVEDIRMIDPVAVGDRVRFRDAGGGQGMIVEVLPRRSKLSRRAVLHGADKPQEKNITREQVIVTNVDRIVAVVSARRPKPSWRLVDRYLADSELLEMPAVICITKMDLVDDVEAFRSQLEVYHNIGLYTSAVTGAGMDELRGILANETSVLMGKSGVGKTTLLNTLEPGLGLRVQEVSDRVNKGRHTTTHLEMFPLARGGFVIDTPGMREFAPWLAERVNTAWLFREMRPYIGRCKFGTGCTHSHEPGCAVKQAVASGSITERRYDSYLRILGSSG